AGAADFLAVHPDAAAALGLDEAADDVQEGALAAAARPDDGDELALAHAEPLDVEDRQRLAVLRIDLPDAGSFQRDYAHFLSAAIAICRIFATRIFSLGQQPLEISLHFLRIPPLAANAAVPQPAADGARALPVRADLARDAHHGFDPGLAAASVAN